MRRIPSRRIASQAIRLRRVIRKNRGASDPSAQRRNRNYPPAILRCVFGRTDQWPVADIKAVFTSFPSFPLQETMTDSAIRCTRGLKIRFRGWWNATKHMVWRNSFVNAKSSGTQRVRAPRSSSLSRTGLLDWNDFRIARQPLGSSNAPP
jgi:hypothetical protein